MVTAEKSDPRDDQKRQREIFADWAANGKTVRVHPEQCIPFTNVRKVCRPGVDRLETSFLQQGYYFLSGRPLLCLLSKTTDLGLIQACVQRRDSLKEGEVESAVAKYDTWYGIVDGAHRIAALLRLVRKGGEWEKFMFNAGLAPPNTPKKSLVQAARANNDLSDETHRVEATIYEQILGMKEEAMELTRNSPDGKAVHPVEVAQAYCGNPDLEKSSASAQRARVAMHVSEEALSVIEEITCFASKTVQSGTSDPRTFRKLVTYNLLKTTGAAFSSAPPAKQAAALHRIFDSAVQNSKYQCSKSELMSALSGSEHALREVKKMDEVLRGDEWPTAMRALQKNLTQTSKLDADCESNAGNDRTLLPLLRSRYLESGGVLAETRIANFENPGRDKEATTAEKEAPDTQPTPGDNSADNNAVATVDKEPVTGPPPSNEASGNASEAEDPPIMEGNEPRRVVAPDPDEILLSVGVRVWSGRWQDVRASINIFDEMTGKVDMVLTDIPYDLPRGRNSGSKGPFDFIENAEIEQFVQMSRSLLKPGAFIVIFHSFDQAHVIKPLLEAAKFIVPACPVVVAKDQDSIQKNTSNLFPQQSYEVYTVATRDLRGLPRTFYPKLDDKTNPYKFLKTKSKRKFNVVTDVPTKARKLCRSGQKRLVRSSEKPVALLREILETYCPEDGLVLDPYGGTFSTAIASIESCRRCFAVEADPECAELSKRRLVSTAKSRLLRDERQNRMVLAPDESTRGTEVDDEDTAHDDFEERSDDDCESSSEEPSSPAQETVSADEVPVRRQGGEGVANESLEDQERNPPGELVCQQVDCQFPGLRLSRQPGLCSHCKLRMHDLCAFKKPLTAADNNELVKYCSNECWVQCS